MLKDLVYHSVNSFSLLISDQQIPYAEVNKTKKYIDDLKSISNLGIEKVANIFGLINHISVDEFVEVFSKILNGTLINSSGWRRYLLQTFVANPPKGALSIYSSSLRLGDTKGYTPIVTLK